MDTAPSQGIVKRVRSIAGGVKGVNNVEKCYVRKMGFDYHVDIHIQVDAYLSVAEGHRIAHLVKDALVQKDLRIINVMVHIEPS